MIILCLSNSRRFLFGLVLVIQDRRRHYFWLLVWIEAGRKF